MGITFVNLAENQYHTMKNRGKRVPLFFSSLFIVLLHLPFVFAKVKPPDAAAKKTTAAFADADWDNNSFLKNEFAGTVTENYSGNMVYDSLHLAAAGLSQQVFGYAVRGFEYLKQSGKIINSNILTIADFSKSSCKKRLFVIDMKNCRMLFHTYVAHGMNSGQEFARFFSNIPQSNKSSLGFYQTAGTYTGKNGYSLHLIGLERGINDNAFNRDIVMHGAGYVSETLIQAQGFLGRSQGCPAVPEKLHKPIIDKIKNGTCLFIFGEDKNYLQRSAVLKKSMPLIAAG